MTLFSAETSDQMGRGGHENKQGWMVSHTASCDCLVQTVFVVDNKKTALKISSVL